MRFFASFRLSIYATHDVRLPVGVPGNWVSSGAGIDQITAFYHERDRHLPGSGGDTTIDGDEGFFLDLVDLWECESSWLERGVGNR